MGNLDSHSETTTVVDQREYDAGQQQMNDMFKQGDDSNLAATLLENHQMVEQMVARL